MLARRIAPLAALLVVGLIAVVLIDGGASGSGHRLHVTVAEATNLLAGQELKSGGGKIGVIDDIDTVEGGARARITLRVEDRAWPLPRGTRFAVRYGGTASFYNRHILVTPGPAGAPPLGENATIPAKDFAVPVEVDQLLAVFDNGVRRDLKSFVNRSGVALDRSRVNLTSVLEKTPQAVQQGAAVMGDLVDDRGALDVTLRRTDSVVDAIRRADPGLQQLLTGAAVTFGAIADKQQQLGTTLERMPAMLRQTRSTLGRAQATLQGAGTLARRLGPGVRQLRATAAPLDRVLASLLRIAPDAKATLATVRRSTPQLNAFLARATTTAPQLASISDKSIENLQCIRPWTPEITALLMTWGDFMSWSDGKDKILRAQIQSYLPANYNAVPFTPAQAAQQFSGLRYGFPRPPGYNAGQPWYQPKCGAGPEAVDPAQDQEAKAPNTSPLPRPAKGQR